MKFLLCKGKIYFNQQYSKNLKIILYDLHNKSFMSYLPDGGFMLLRNMLR